MKYQMTISIEKEILDQLSEIARERGIKGIPARTDLASELLADAVIREAEALKITGAC